MLRKIYQLKTFCLFFLAFIGPALSEVVNALPIPSAFTESEFDLSVQLSGVELHPVLFLPISPTATTNTAVTAVDAVGELSGHLATADSYAAIRSHEVISSGGSFSGSVPVFDISMANSTLAESWWNGPVGARAIAHGQAGFDDVAVTVTSDASLTFAWNFNLLNLQTTPLASQAMIQHMVSLAIAPLAPGAGESRTVSVGFSAVSHDGEIDWTAYDIPGSTAIQVWLEATVAQLSTGSTTPLSGPIVVVPLAPGAENWGGDGEDFILSLDVSHLEMAVEAPLAPVNPVGELAKSSETGALVHWDVDTGQLSFDLLPLNMLFDASGRSMTAAQDDLLAGAYLKIDPLGYVREEDASGYFKGSGDLQLVSDNGEVLVQASISGLLYDERLYEREGFNLFAPLLDSKVFDVDSSKWLQEFVKRMNSDVLFLPELFVDIGFPIGVTATEDRWAASFDAPVNAALSFAGPAVSVSISGTAGLFLIGLFCWPLARSCRQCSV